MRTLPLRATCVWALPVLLASLLAGCAAPAGSQGPASYITLLSAPDGTVGQVLLRGARGEQRISQARHAAPLDGSRPAAPVDEAAFQRDFADAIAARPALPQHFVLYFETGDTRLTAGSQSLLAQIVAATAQRPNVDLSVIGHSDTVGTAEQNEALSLQRAEAVAELLRSQGLQGVALQVASHGEHNLLISTPDDTPEPRNRRVEVTVR